MSTETSNTTSQQERRPVKYYCCGCNSRTSTIIASTFLLLGGCLYSVVALVGLNDTSIENAPTDDERVLLQGLLGIMTVQVIISVLAIWGACTYRGWPVLLSLGWVTVGVALGTIGMVLSMNFYALIGIILQLYFFWSPMYGYVYEYKDLKAWASNYELTEAGDGRQAGGYSDGDEGDVKTAVVEMV